MFSNLATPSGQAPAKPAKIVTGQYLAKATRYSPWLRAVDAARWLRGELSIQPTVKLAAKTFGVSVPLVAEAREWLASREILRRGGATPWSDDAIERIVTKLGVERVWRAVDKLTQPSLPLAAAE